MADDIALFCGSYRSNEICNKLQKAPNRSIRYFTKWIIAINLTNTIAYLYSQMYKFVREATDDRFKKKKTKKPIGLIE